jgi:penicillin amidase
MTIAKGLAFGLSFDLDDLDLTVSLLTFLTAGQVGGFDGVALFFEDLFRTAPFDPALTLPDFLGGAGAASLQGNGSKAMPRPQMKNGKLGGYLDGRSLQMAKGFREHIDAIPMLRSTLDGTDTPKGSNWWVASGAVTESGYPLLANDPHLTLDNPSTFYEAHLRVRRGEDRPMNIYGVTFPGGPLVAQGCNPWICWGSTVNPLDVTDLYQEVLVIQDGVPVATLFDGQPEPLVLIPQTYNVNVIGDGMPDNLADAGVGPLEGGLTLIVPRRNHGPIVAVDLSDPDLPLGLSVQYTGWRATREVDAFRTWARAGSVEAFEEGARYFDVGSQNWAYADVNGNIAYFTGAEAPLREDLQTLLFPDGGFPPYLIRDGSGGLQHEWLPATNPTPDQSLGYAILPFEEMPHAVNPERGYILNCNNDPVGTSLDNIPFNQLRPGGGLYYLSPGYASGFRQGRLVRAFEQALEDTGNQLTVGDFARLQGNNQLLDAEVLVPYILAAFENASGGGAPPELAALAADAGIAEAVGRLTAWDFSTPTGIQGGFDPEDDPFNLPAPDAAEIEASVAATIYSTWRGQAVQNIIDASLGPLASEGPGSNLAMTALRNLLDNFPQRQGVGTSGLPFFVVPGVPNPEAARDVILLQSLRDALDLLASDTFAAAFANSTDQADYRWGYLHRITFDHPFGGPFSIPTAGGGFPDLAPGLSGIARSGGFGALDASSHSARADGLNEFKFGSGPARRFVGHLTPGGVDAMQVIPGGQSGVLGSPFQFDQLLLWLTNHYHPVYLTPGQVVGAIETYQQLFPVP